MPSEQRDAEEVQGAKLIYRLHGLSWLFLTGVRIRQTIIPLAAFMLFGAKNDQFPWLIALPAAVVAIVISAFWDQWFYRYGFSRKGLVIRKGLFFRNVRVLDYDRIENVDTERGILHRLLEVADVRVETSSGGRSEAIIRVLDDHAVKELRSRIFERSDRREVATEEKVDSPAGETLLELPMRELVRYGLIDNRGMIIVAALLGVFSQFGMDQLIERYVEPFIERLPIDSFIHLGTAMQVFLVTSAILGLVAGTRILSILLALITLHGFKLTRSGDDLRAQYGLLTKVSLTMRRPRIQVVHQRESLLHRWFKRVSLRVDLAGGLGRNSGNQQQQGGNKRTPWLAPVATSAKAEELVREALPVVETGNLDWQKLAPKARFRLGRFLSLCWLIIATPSTVIQLGWWSLAVILPMLPVLWLYAHLYVKYTGWALHEKFFVLRKGWLNKRMAFVPRNRVQSVRVNENPFDRRYHMASLSVDTAGARHQRLHLPFLDRESADSLSADLYRAGR